MTNKIKDQGEHYRKSQSHAHHHHSQQKITESFVHRMIEKISTSDNNDKPPSLVFAQPKEHHSSQFTAPKSFINIKRQIIKTEVSPVRVDPVLKSSKSGPKKEVQTEEETDSCSYSKKEYRVKNSKEHSTGKSSDFTSFLAEKMKHLKQKKFKEFMAQQSNFNSIYYGLNVVQIKKIQATDRTEQKEIPGNRSKPKTPSLSKGSIRSGTNRIKTKSFNPQQTQNQSLELISNKQAIFSEQRFSKQDKQKKLRPKTRILEIKEYQKKMKKMLNCMDIILNSFHCSLDNPKRYLLQKMPIEGVTLGANSFNPAVKKTRFQYYVGPGNNANLIRSLLRKRSWWVEVDSIAKANLVWTQLKVSAVLDRVERHPQEDWTSDIIFYEEVNESKEEKNSAKKSSSTANSQTYKVSQDSFDLLFHQKQSKRYRSILDVQQAESRLEHILTPEVIHNHYEHNYMFGNKNALYYNLSAYCQFARKELSQMVPVTFYLEKGSKKGLNEFEKVFHDYKKNRSGVWILKPAENSNRGHGIEVTNSLQEIKLKLNQQKKLIVQHYIRNLLLYNNRKFDIRAYMVAVTINGRVKFFWYEEGYIRTSSETYDIDNLRDPFIHLTNDAIQSKGQNYGRYEEGNKLSYSQFQRYLDTRFQRQNWKVCDLHQRMKQIALESVRATYCRIDPAKRNFSFELFGLDFIVDSQFRPFLIEVNTNPCLELSSPVLARLIPRMMENMFRISIDPLFRPSLEISYSKSELYYLYDQSFLDRNKFGLMFDQKFDRDFQWEERCQKMKGLEWKDQDEQEYSDEGRFIVVNY